MVRLALAMLVRVFVEPLIEVPVKVVIVSPSDTKVEPMVIDELVRALLGMFVKVFVSPDIDLLVSVSVPARVASVPVVGKVTLVLPVVVRAKENAPEVVKDPAVEMFPPSVVV